jgi:hypothetical protein
VRLDEGDGRFRGVERFDDISQAPQGGVDALLQPGGLFTRALELDEQRPTAWDEHLTVGETATAADVELQVNEAVAVEPPHEGTLHHRLEHPHVGQSSSGTY